MAFELANLKDSSTCLNLLHKIEHIPELSSYCALTKAELYMKCHICDSAIYYAKQWEYNSYESTSLIICAQAYSYIGAKDSATYYAKKVCAISQSLADMNNALYILTCEDDSKDKTAIRETASDRADIQKILEIRQGKLSQAVQLLEQDLRRKPNLLWMYSAIAAFLIAGGVFYWRFRVRRQQMRADVDQLVERQVETIVQSIKQHIDKNDLAHTLHWKNYSAMKADADLYMGGIVRKLEDKYLNETEIRFCVLTMLEFPLSQIAETIHYSYPSGIKTLKKRTSTKLGTTPPNLHDFLLALAAKL